MHNVETLNVGSIDGNIICSCSWSKYAVYPNAGWGRKSVGIRNTIGTKKEWLAAKLSGQYIAHVTNVERVRVRFGN